MSMIFAYIDPFTGSLLLQLLVMGFMSILVFFKKVKSFTLGLFGLRKDATVDAEEVQTISLHAEKSNDRNQEKKAA